MIDRTGARGVSFDVACPGAPIAVADYNRVLERDDIDIVGSDRSGRILSGEIRFVSFLGVAVVTTLMPVSDSASRTLLVGKVSGCAMAISGIFRILSLWPRRFRDPTQKTPQTK